MSTSQSQLAAQLFKGSAIGVYRGSVSFEVIDAVRMSCSLRARTALSFCPREIGPEPRVESPLRPGPLLMTVCSLVFVTCALGPAGDPAAAMLHLSAGARLHVEGRLEDAVAEYEQAIGLDPKNPDAFYNRGLAREEIGESRRALRDFDAALRLKPEQPEALYHRGNVLDDLGSHEEAVRDYDAAIELASHGKAMAMATRNRGIALFKQRIGADGSAGEDRRPSGYLERCDFYQSRARGQRALEDCDAAIRMNAKDARAYLLRGNAYSSLGQFHRAVRDYTRSVVLAGPNADAFFNRGVAKANLGEVRAAISDYSLALSVDLGYANAYGARAVAYASVGDDERAESDLLLAVEHGIDGDDLRGELEWVRRVRDRSVGR